MMIEEQIRCALSAVRLPTDHRVAELLTGRSFAAVILADGSVGVAMDYSHFRCPVPGVEEVTAIDGERAMKALGVEDEEPLDRATLLTRSHHRLSETEQATKIALLGALSRSLFRPASLADRGLRHQRVGFEDLQGPGPYPDALVEALGDADTVGVIGFGGLMDAFARLPQIRRVLVSDLNGEPRRQRIERYLERYNRQFAAGGIEFVGPDVDRLKAECPVVQVTPSSLCNGTMDEVLATFAGRPLILVGPSGAVVPEVWFDHGVVLVCTEIKDSRYVHAYKYDDYLYDWYTEYDDRLLIWRD